MKKTVKTAAKKKATLAKIKQVRQTVSSFCIKAHVVQNKQA